MEEKWKNPEECYLTGNISAGAKKYAKAFFHRSYVDTYHSENSFDLGDSTTEISHSFPDCSDVPF